MTRVGVAMGGKDAKHLYEETPEEPKHTVKVLHLDPARRVTIDELCGHVQDRVDRLPILRRQLRRSRFTHPWWAEADDLDVAAQVTTEVLAAGRAARWVAIGRELERPLDRDRPLWRLRLLDAPDGQTLVFAASHALLDGEVAARVLEALFGPDRIELASQARPLRPRRAETVRLAGCAPRLLMRLTRAAVRKRRDPLGRTAARPFSGAAGPWNANTRTAGRGYAEASFDLDPFLAAARRDGATFTELSIALVGGALRQVCPDASRCFLAAVPVSTRRAGDAATEPNLASVAFVDSGSQVANLAERLQVVRSSLRAGRARIAAGDPRLFADAWEIWPLLRGLHQVSRVVARRLGAGPPASLAISTVRGPAMPLSVAGVSIASVVSGGLVVDELGLNVTIWSAAGRVSFGVTGRPALIDVAAVAEAIEVEHAKLCSGESPLMVTP